ncbi:MAG TPA: hypothetical protein VHB70_13645 [Parafilimonas sp.]|nr:hypothetical protein [Parafilimonas sp.]
MPWSEYNYPASMKNLPIVVRNKAIEIANALYEKGNMDEGVIIATAIKHAKAWGENEEHTDDADKFRQDES